jgi:hypothetical protein
MPEGWASSTLGSGKMSGRVFSKMSNMDTKPLGACFEACISLTGERSGTPKSFYMILARDKNSSDVTDMSVSLSFVQVSIKA